MKRYLLIISLLFISTVIYASQFHSDIWIKFKDGQLVHDQANSFWTKHNIKEDYYEYYNFDPDWKDIPNSAYTCLWDCHMCNPISSATEEEDFTRLRDKIQNTGHTCHYYIKESTTINRYGISLPKDEFEYIKVQN